MDDFVATLSKEQLRKAAFVGTVALRDEQAGRKPEQGKYQYLLEDFPKLFE